MNIITGDRPTGPLHLGHYVGSLVSRLELQNSGNNLFILIADTQVLNNDIKKSRHTREYTLRLMRDYLSVGLDSATFVLQSQIPQIFELTNYLSNLVTLPMVMRIPTIKAEQKMYGGDNMGFLNYPISQTADIAVFDGEMVPVGEDQAPILEFANDILDKFHYHFNCNLFKKIKPVLSQTPRLVGIDGNNKMSKSLDNAIYLSDSSQEVKAKINKMYTDSKHLKVSDPGQVEGNVVFTFLDVFMRDRVRLQELKYGYEKGGVGDVYLKGILMGEIEHVLVPIREKASTLNDKDLMERLMDGTKRARDVAEKKMSEVREVIFK